MPVRWSGEGRRTVHKDRWIELSAERVVTAQGAVLDPYYTLTYPDWSVAVVLTPENDVVMIRQYRHGLGLVDLELPGGCVDPEDASPLMAAQREVLEETGYGSDEAEYIGRFGANPSLQTNFVHVSLIRNARPVAAARPEAGEEIIVEIMPLEAVRRAALSGEMMNSMHIAAVFLALDRLAG